MEPIKRDYSISDAAMLEAADTCQAFLNEDLADFATFDADFDTTYIADWNAKIEAAALEDTDETVDDQLKQLTAIVEEKMIACRSKYQDSKYFIEKAFPNKPVIWNEFGYNDYKDAQGSQPRLLLFMYKFHKVALKYAGELGEAGFTAAHITEIFTLADALRDANVIQNVFMGNIPVRTAARIEKMNAVWKVMTTVCQVGKRIYKNNYARYHRYILPASQETSESFSLTGIIRRADNGQPIDAARITLPLLSLSVFSDETGTYGFGAIPPGSYTVTVEKTGFQTQTLEHIAISEGEITNLSISLEVV